MSKDYPERLYVDFISNKKKSIIKKTNKTYWFLFHVSKNDASISKKKLKNLFLNYCLVIYEQQELQIELPKKTHDMILEIHQWGVDNHFKRIELIDPNLHQL